MKTRFTINDVVVPPLTVFTLPDGTTRSCMGVKNPKKLAEAIDVAWTLTSYERTLLQDYIE